MSAPVLLRRLSYYYILIYAVFRTARAVGERPTCPICCEAKLHVVSQHQQSSRKAAMDGLSASYARSTKGCDSVLRWWWWLSSIAMHPGTLDSR